MAPSPVSVVSRRRNQALKLNRTLLAPVTSCRAVLLQLLRVESLSPRDVLSESLQWYLWPDSNRHSVTRNGF